MNITQVTNIQYGGSRKSWSINEEPFWESEEAQLKAMLLTWTAATKWGHKMLIVNHRCLDITRQRAIQSVCPEMIRGRQRDEYPVSEQEQ